MGPVAVVVLVVAVLIVGAIGFQSFIAAVGVAIVFGLFLRYLTDEYYDFLHGFSAAMVNIGIASILLIFINPLFPLLFWILYIALLIFYGIAVNRSTAEAKEDAQPILKDLQDFLEDYAHFMQDHYRYADVYWEGMGIQIQLQTRDAETERDAYRKLERAHDDSALNALFFGEYQPISKHYYNCYMLLDEGTPEMGEGSFVYTMMFASIGSFKKKGYIFRILSNRMKEKYPNSFKEYNHKNFGIGFNRTK